MLQEHFTQLITTKTRSVSVSVYVSLQHINHHQVHNIYRVTHSHCNRAINILLGSRVWYCCLPSPVQTHPCTGR